MKLYEQGMKDREIGEAVGTSAAVICQWRKRRQIPSQQSRKEKIMLAYKKETPKPKEKKCETWYSPSEFVRQWERGIVYQNKPGSRRGVDMSMPLKSVFGGRGY